MRAVIPAMYTVVENGPMAGYDRESVRVASRRKVRAHLEPAEYS